MGQQVLVDALREIANPRASLFATLMSRLFANEADTQVRCFNSVF
jgi:hypothetical protein